MENIKYLIRLCDYFGVGLSFNYKSDKKYKSIFGGIIFILFILICMIYSIILVTEYITNRPITVIYYKKELPITDIYSLFYLKTGIAVKANCDDTDSNDYDIQKLLKIQMAFCKIERINGNRVKSKINIPLKKCEYNDFYNLLNEEMDYNGIVNNFLCPENNNFTLSGTYFDEIFEYLEITLTIENETQNENLTKLLYEKECKLSYFFTDYAVDVNNQTNPVKIYLNEKFLELSPVQYKKINLYFDIIEFTSDESYIFNFPEKNEYGAFSTFDSYEIYKGNNRYKIKGTEYDHYAKIYIRVDSTRNLIERRYQKLNDLFANISSPLSCLLLVLYFIMTYLNNIFVVNSVIKTIYRTRQQDSYRKQKFKEILKNRIDIKILNNIEAEISEKREINKGNDENSKQKILACNPNLKLKRSKSFREVSPINNNIPKINKLINKLIWNSICHIFPCSKTNNIELKVISGLTLSFYEQLDIYNYFKHLQMIKIISYITMHSSEFYLVQYLSNPNISLGIRDFYQLSTDKKNSLENAKIDDFWIIFQKLINKKNKNRREKKICKLICSDINNILSK